MTNKKLERQINRKINYQKERQPIQRITSQKDGQAANYKECLQYKYKTMTIITEDTETELVTVLQHNIYKMQKRVYGQK